MKSVRQCNIQQLPIMVIACALTFGHLLAAFILYCPVQGIAEPSIFKQIPLLCFIDYLMFCGAQCFVQMKTMVDV